jgi:uncharacterized protein with von Willebrand factor type A (vWA) domain
MMDVGGSMDPHAYVMSQLFSAAKRASHFKELRTYYFHNCVYGRVYKTEAFLEPVTLRDVMAECNPTTKLVMVGDALMAPYELLGSSGFTGDEGRVPGLEWLRHAEGSLPSRRVAQPGELAIVPRHHDRPHRANLPHVRPHARGAR